MDGSQDDVGGSDDEDEEESVIAGWWVKERIPEAVGVALGGRRICRAARRPERMAAWTVPQWPVVSVCSPAK